jgi:hypothetical protein
MLRAALLLVLAALPPAGAGLGRSEAGPPAKFTHVPHGWRAFDRDLAVVSSHGGGVQSYALSWAYRPSPFGWANRMPRNAIAVSVILIRDSRCGALHRGDFPAIKRFPLRLPRTTRDRQEGRPDIPEYRVFGRIGESYNVDLRVDVNNIRPSRAMLRVAQRVVDGIHFPKWPRPARC